MISMDIQFKAIKDYNLAGVPINVVAREEYVSKIE